jgi:hypothetical protein
VPLVQRGDQPLDERARTMASTSRCDATV